MRIKIGNNEIEIPYFVFWLLFVIIISWIYAS